MTYPRSLGKYLAKLRKEAGLSLQQVADQVGTHRSTVLRYEDGTFDEPSLTVLLKIADALGADPEEIYARVGDNIAEQLPSPQLFLRAKGLSKQQADELVARLDEMLDESGDQS